MSETNVQKISGDSCRSCKSGKVVRKVEIRERKIGSFVVQDKTFVDECTECKESLIPMADAIHCDCRMARAILFSGYSIDGEVFRFARKALGATQRELAVALQVTTESISRWECGHEDIQRVTQLALGGLIARVELQSGAERCQPSLPPNLRTVVADSVVLTVQE